MALVVQGLRILSDGEQHPSSSVQDVAQLGYLPHAPSTHLAEPAAPSLPPPLDTAGPPSTQQPRREAEMSPQCTSCIESTLYCDVRSLDLDGVDHADACESCVARIVVEQPAYEDLQAMFRMYVYHVTRGLTTTPERLTRIDQEIVGSA